MKFFTDECCDAGIVASLRNVIENNRVLMEKNKSKHFSTYEEAAEWFNNHDMADFEDQLLVNQMLKERLRELR